MLLYMSFGSNNRYCLSWAHLCWMVPVAKWVWYNSVHWTDCRRANQRSSWLNPTGLNLLESLLDFPQLIIRPYLNQTISMCEGQKIPVYKLSADYIITFLCLCL